MIFRVPSRLLQTVAFVCSAWACMGQPQGVTRILYNDPSVTYTGSWYLNHETPNIGGSATLTNSKGATAALSFTGTGITWIGVLDQYSGLAQVYLDGTPNTVDTYGANTQYGQSLFSVHGLAPGTHTLSIQVLHQRDGLTSGSWIWINAFDIENGSGIAGGVSASSGHIEQNDPAITYTGNWYLNTNPSMSGGSAVLATDANSSATISFTGTGISWIGYQDQWSGLANIYVDGALQTPQVDTFASPQKVQSTVYSINNLSPGTHTLMIVVTATHGASSAGSWIWIDAFNIAGSS